MPAFESAEVIPERPYSPPAIHKLDDQQGPPVPPKSELQHPQTAPAFPQTNGHATGPLTVQKRRSNPLSADVPRDDDAVRWAEKIKERRIISKRRMREEEIDDDRVLIGTKVAEGHGNFETAYNMLTGIRFCVSR